MADTALAKPRLTTLEFVELPSTRAKMAKVQTKVLDPEKVVRLTLNAMQKIPKLKATTLESMLGCMMTATSLGLEPNTVLEHAWIIPYANRRKGRDGKWYSIVEAQFMVGYRGYVALAYRFPDLDMLHADAICDKDDYESYISSAVASATFFKHQKNLKDPGEPIGSYCFTRLNRGGRGMDVVTELPKAEIELIRERSETYKALKSRLNTGSAADIAKAEKNFEETPWNMWWRSMWAKSAIRRHVKQFPLTAEMSAAVAIEDAADTGMLDITKMGDPETVRAVMHGETEPPIEDVEFEETPPLDVGEDARDPEPPPEPVKKTRGRPKKDAAADPKPEPEAAEASGKAPPLAETEHADPRPEPPPAEEQPDEPEPGSVEDNDNLFAD